MWLKLSFCESLHHCKQWEHEMLAPPVTKVGEIPQGLKQACLQSTALLESSVYEMWIWAKRLCREMGKVGNIV